MLENLNLTRKQVYIAVGAVAFLFILGMALTFWDLNRNMNSTRSHKVNPNSNSSSRIDSNTNIGTNTNSSTPQVNQQPIARTSNNTTINSGNTSLKSSEGKEIREIIGGFFMYLNNKNYSKVLEYLHPHFVEDNNITIERIQKYFQTEYPSTLDYKINSINYDQKTLYNVKVIVIDKSYPMNDFTANYTFEKISGKFKMYIPHMIKTP